MNILSLFDGISVARVALERANIKVDKYFSSEIDKYAIQVSTKNWPDIIQLGDVKNITKDLLSSYQGVVDIDLLIGGSPCQDLSIAKRNREGLSGSRSGLFYEYVRILNEIKPKYFILENVNSMPKEAKEQITKELFGIAPIMINAALVSAQNRKRLFWVGKKEGDKYIKVDVLLPEDKNIFLKDILEKEVDEKYFISKKLISGFYNKKGKWGGRFSPIEDTNIKCPTLTARYFKLSSTDPYIKTIKIGQIGKGGQGDRIYSIEGKSVNLSANGGGRGAKTGLYHIPHGYIKEKITEEEKYPTLYGQTPSSKHLILIAPNGKQIENEEGVHCFKEVRTEKGKKERKEFRLLTGKDSTKRGKEDKKYIPQKTGKANCITTSLGMEGTISDDYDIRKLTPIETERLQSLDDNYTKGISNSQRYKCCGNAFNAEVVKHILSFIK
jgi:DNA (cytosine-5)-methyltransferase 3A